jgi:hypothetical protein
MRPSSTLGRMLSQRPTDALTFHPRPFRDGLNFVDDQAIKATTDEHQAVLTAHHLALREQEGRANDQEAWLAGVSLFVVVSCVGVLGLSIVALVQGLALRRLRRELAGLTSTRAAA